VGDLKCLRPEVDERTRVLVLGTLPGARSLELQQYYAHGRNRFWRLMEKIVGVPAAVPYAERVARLMEGGVGLWDTLEACARDGSLDSKITNAKANDLAALLGDHPSVAAIALNGAKAAAVYDRQISGTLSGVVSEDLCVMRLPSTSPANARAGFETLLAEWQQIRPWLSGAER